MPCRYDLLVIDLDGTLLRSDGAVSLRNRRAICDARGAGIEVVIATGRSLAESRHALDAIDHDGLMIAAGGSLLSDVCTGRTLDRRPLPSDVVAEITHALVQAGHKVLILKDAHATGYDYLAVGPPHSELDPASQWWFEQMRVDVRFIDDLADDAHPEDTIRAGAVACGSKLAPLCETLRVQMGDRCFMQHWSAVTSTAAIGAATHLLEVFTLNVNKWTMVQALCERRRVEVARVAAIGDGLNDVELVQNAGLGVAMANAGPQVLAAAKRTTADHNADGVADAIEQILCGAW